MHEMSITSSIVSIVAKEAAARRVLRDKLEIGKLSGVVPDAIRFCFDVISKGTVVDGARLEIVEIAGQGQCQACGADVVLETMLSQCYCGSYDIDRRCGEELRIKEMELEAI